MNDRSPPALAETAPARRRLLDTATRLFYANGIHAVGIDWIIAEAAVAKATFYKHFPSKDDLVVAYIEEQDQLGRVAVAALPTGTPRQMLAATLGRISTAATADSFRGCPFINAAAEYPAPKSAVRRAIDSRRTWYHGVLHGHLAAAGSKTPELTASLLVALSDGLLEFAYLNDPAQVLALVEVALARLLD